MVSIKQTAYRSKQNFKPTDFVKASFPRTIKVLVNSNIYILIPLILLIILDGSYIESLLGSSNLEHSVVYILKDLAIIVIQAISVRTILSPAMSRSPFVGILPLVLAFMIQEITGQVDNNIADIAAQSCQYVAGIAGFMLGRWIVVAIKLMASLISMVLWVRLTGLCETGLCLGSTNITPAKSWKAMGGLTWRVWIGSLIAIAPFLAAHYAVSEYLEDYHANIIINALAVIVDAVFETLIVIVSAAYAATVFKAVIVDGRYSV